MNSAELQDFYGAYIACLNARDWDALDRYVHPDAQHNGRPFGVAGYRSMLERDVREIPDLRFTVAFTVCEPPRIAARLGFDCHPARHFLGLPIDGRHVTFTENVFYELRDGRIAKVWSLIDKAAIEAALGSDQAASGASVEGS